MANFRRSKPACRTKVKLFNKHEKFPDAGERWLRRWPAWHDIIFNRRPARRVNKAMERRILMDRVDPDDTAWPLAKKPHVYYW